MTTDEQRNVRLCESKRDGGRGRERERERMREQAKRGSNRGSIKVVSWWVRASADHLSVSSLSLSVCHGDLGIEAHCNVLHLL